MQSHVFIKEKKQKKKVKAEIFNKKKQKTKQKWEQVRTTFYNNTAKRLVMKHDNIRQKLNLEETVT